MNANRMAGKVVMSGVALVALVGTVAQAGWSGRGGGDQWRSDRDRDRAHVRDRDRHDWHFTPHYAPRGHEVHVMPRVVLRTILGGLEFHYAEGSFYRHVAGRYVVVQAPVGAVVTTVSAGCQPVVVEGTPYYFINGNTYVYTGVGYQVVPPPRALVLPPPPPEVVAPVVMNVQGPAAQVRYTAPVAADSVYTVNIPNSRGTYSAVTLTRSGNGFVGPQGEFYTEFPRIEQMKAMYGK